MVVPSAKSLYTIATNLRLVELMNIQDFTAEDERFVRQYAYDDAHVVAVDLADEFVGAGSVDVIGETVIVVGDGDEQFELDVPGVSQAFIRNGVLTIEMEVDA